MAVDRQSVIFFIIVFIFLLLPAGNDQPHSNRERKTLKTFQDEIKRFELEFFERQYYKGYGNITGFQKSYQDMVEGKSEKDWPFHKFTKESPWVEDERFSVLPNVVSDEVKGFWGIDPVDDNGSSAYLFNISGKSYGSFERSKDKLNQYPMSIPDYLTKFMEYQDFPIDNDDNNDNSDNTGHDKANDIKAGDIDYKEGKISFGIKSLGYNFQNPELYKHIKTDEDKIDNAVLVKVKLTLQDNPEIEFSELDTFGVYFQNTGSMITMTNSAKFYGDFALPQFTMNEDNFAIATKLIGQYFNISDTYNDVSMDDMTGSLNKALQQCEFINFIQLEKTDYLLEELRMIDEELSNPSGAPIPKDLPQIKVKNSLSYSPDCGLLIRNKTGRFEGEKLEVITQRQKNVFIGFIFLIACQLYLFMRQIRIATTPGHLSNISTITLMMLQYEDSLIALVFLLISTLFEELYLLLACIAIFTYIMCGVFEMGFLTLVMKTQINERGTTWWQILRGSTSRTSSNEGQDTEQSTANTTELPRPVTDPINNTTTPVQGFADQDSNVWNSIFAPGFAITIMSTFLILNSSMWRKKYRTIFEMIGLIFINSYWIPQFLRNTLKNRRVPFTWTFILGTSIIRLLPVIYLNLFNNVFRHSKHPLFAIVLILWVAIQIGLFYLQETLGPRFWINDNWLPKAYDYHPIISIEDLEQGFSSDLLGNMNVEETNSEEINKEEFKCKSDCAICMTEVELPVFKQKPKSIKNNKEYMITPCFHIFHTECLEDWMKYKLQCPVCRNGLPPV